MSTHGHPADLEQTMLIHISDTDDGRLQRASNGSAQLPACALGHIASPLHTGGGALKTVDQSVDHSWSSASSDASAQRKSCTSSDVPAAAAAAPAGLRHASPWLHERDMTQRASGARGAALKRQPTHSDHEDEDTEGLCCYPHPALKCKAGLAKGSHSNVEKSRRDRMNTLIDMLGEEVPPQSSGHACLGPGNRRPKHVVLSDTLELLHKMKQSIKDYEQRLGQPSSSASACVLEPEARAPTTGPHDAAATACVFPAQAPAPRPPTPSDGVEQLATRVQVQPAPDEVLLQHQPSCQATQLHAPAEEQAPCQGIALHVRQEDWQAQEGGVCDVTMADDMEEAGHGPDSAAMAPSPEPQGLGPASDAALLELSPGPPDCLPEVAVLEQGPGSFSIVLRCVYRPDLHMDIVQALNALDFSLDHASFGIGPDDSMAEVQLHIRGRPGCCVTADGVHMALYMAASWECPQLRAGANAQRLEAGGDGWSDLSMKLQEVHRGDRG